ncbi:MAG: hypothetical protein HY253_12385 [Burkholderiales bacterium]|nr:hypothetical protein [Burkholderiales bacterium]
MSYRTIPLFLPLPALLASFYIFQLADAGRGIYLQQTIVAAIAFVLCFWFTTRANTGAQTNSSQRALKALFVTALLLYLPSVLALIKSDPTLAHRLLSLGGIRIYLAACLLPACLYLIAKIASNANQRQTLTAAIALILFALAMQTDAAQAMAFAGAIAFIIWRSGWTFAQITSITVLCIANLTLAWMREPNIAPVNYVEGVIQLASSQHLFAGITIGLVALILPTGLAWIAWKGQQPGIAAAALYYLIISACAFAQLTPMPLLGFGASPIIGYFLLAGLMRRD